MQQCGSPFIAANDIAGKPTKGGGVRPDDTRHTNGRAPVPTDRRSAMTRSLWVVPQCEIGEAGTSTGGPHATVRGGTIRGSLNHFKI
jgi:hypothetical protein